MTIQSQTTKERKGSKKPATSEKNKAVSGKHEAMIAADQERAQQLFGAIDESVKIMSERLQAGDDTREAANSFLLCVSNRFDRFAKPDWHTRFGYEHGGLQIQDNLRRIKQNLSRKTLLPDHGRIDTVLNGLVSEVMRLAQSQSISCEHCEHCLRERYSHGFDAITVGEGFTTDESVDSKTWAYIVERFGESFDGAEGADVLVVALRHIASMAFVGRPGAVKSCVDELLTSMVKDTINEGDLRDRYVAEKLASVQESIRWNEEEGVNA